MRPNGTRKAADSKSKRPVGRPRGHTSESTRTLLVQTAVGCFAVKGLARTKLRDIADAAGVTTGTLYHHFSSKESLYIAAYTWAVEELYRQLGDASNTARGSRAKIVAALDRAALLEERSPELLNLILRAWVEHTASEAVPLPIPPSVLAYLDALAREAVDDGEIDKADIEDLKNVFRAFIWGIGAIAMTSQQAPLSTVRGFKRLVVGSFFKGGSASG